VISKIKRLVHSQKYKKLINNFSYMAIINLANKAIPLIVAPYIVITIGIEKFGIISFALIIAMYFQLITQYSFQLTATKYVSQNRDDIKKLSEHFWLVLTIRFLLAIVTFIIFLIMVFTIEILYAEKQVFFFTFLLVFADILMPLWFFTGIEEMKYNAIFNIIAKVTYAISVFIFIHVDTDYTLIPILNVIPLLILGVYSLYFAHSKFGIYFVQPSFKKIVQELKVGKDIFYSNMSVSLYTTINTVLLGFFTNYTAVGIYTLAEALFNAYNSLIKTYTAVIYPHLARYANESKKLLSQSKKFFRLYIIILFIASIFLFIISGFIIEVLYGKNHEESIFILQILSIALLLEPLGGFFTSYLSLQSKYKTIKMITFKIMIINLIAVLPMLFLFQEKGVAYLFLFISIIQVYLNLKYSPELILKRKVK